MLQALVFDLDDTLLDTSSWLIPIAQSPLFKERISRPLPLMPGARENLEYLTGKYELILLTLGDLDFQSAKIKSLDLEKYFSKIFFANIGKSESKDFYFKKLADTAIEPSLVMSIGNRRSQDIRFAKKMGLRTCLFDYGEHQHETVEMPEDQADFEVKNHFELVRRCRL